MIKYCIVYVCVCAMAPLFTPFRFSMSKGLSEIIYAAGIGGGAAATPIGRHFC